MNVPPFGEFLDANRATVYRFLVAAVGVAEADDCFQETFLSALRAYPRVTEGDRLDRWILRIASRKALDHHRRRATQAVPMDEVPDLVTQGETATAVIDDDLWVAVRSLPPKQRVAVVHRHVLDRPYKEIAEVMGTSEEAARANVHAAVTKLKEMVTP